MPHVITQSCCSDGSCVYSCPVNCIIHPRPAEPGFALTEMLYIDPLACVDCGACVSACPVGAIVAHTRLGAEQLPFLAVNGGFTRPARGVQGAAHRRTRSGVDGARVRRGAMPLTVAIVGSGPAGMYAADELLTSRGAGQRVRQTADPTDWYVPGWPRTTRAPKA